MKKPTIIRIPSWLRYLLSCLPGWKQTDISGGDGIQKHAHRFFALYFTFGVTFMDTDSGRRRLPDAAIVIVPPRQIHGWLTELNSSKGLVGHFHRGHAAHLIEPLDASAV